MGRIPPEPPVTRAQYLEGLKQGRNLYQEQLDRMRRSTQITRAATWLVLVLSFGLLLFLFSLSQQVAQ